MARLESKHILAFHFLKVPFRFLALNRGTEFFIMQVSVRDAGVTFCQAFLVFHAALLDELGLRLSDAATCCLHPGVQVEFLADLIPVSFTGIIDLVLEVLPERGVKQGLKAAARTVVKSGGVKREALAALDVRATLISTNEVVRFTVFER